MSRLCGGHPDPEALREAPLSLNRLLGGYRSLADLTRIVDSLTASSAVTLTPEAYTWGADLLTACSAVTLGHAGLDRLPLLLTACSAVTVGETEWGLAGNLLTACSAVTHIAMNLRF